MKTRIKRRKERLTWEVKRAEYRPAGYLEMHEDGVALVYQWGGGGGVKV